MQYVTKSARGDAGVFYLGYWISKNFGWPFRIMNTDIGIDAETELRDDDGHSMSVIIKIQVKTLTLADAETFTEYIDFEHQEYWENFIGPVLYFVVDIDREQIFFKDISSLDELRLLEKSLALGFDKTKDLLTADKKNFIRDKFRTTGSPIKNLFALFKQLESIGVNVSTQEDYDRQLAAIREFGDQFSKQKALMEHFSWKFGRKGAYLIEQFETLLGRKRSDLLHNFTEEGYN
jgi:hypothetical protein